jgi:hypothetical protein
MSGRLESQLATARENLARLTVQRDAIVKRDDSRHWTEADSATGSGIRRKPNAKADSRRYAGYSRDAEVFAERNRIETLVSVLESRLAYAVAEAGRVRLTRGDIVGAQFIRTELGWAKVRRVNAKSVSVDSGYSWADLIPFDKVLEVRMATA